MNFVISCFIDLQPYLCFEISDACESGCLYRYCKISHFISSGCNCQYISYDGVALKIPLQASCFTARKDNRVLLTASIASCTTRTEPCSSACTLNKSSSGIWDVVVFLPYIYLCQSSFKRQHPSGATGVVYSLLFFCASFAHFWCAKVLKIIHICK